MFNIKQIKTFLKLNELMGVDILQLKRFCYINFENLHTPIFHVFKRLFSGNISINDVLIYELMGKSNLILSLKCLKFKDKRTVITERQIFCLRNNIFIK